MADIIDLDSRRSEGPPDLLHPSSGPPGPVPPITGGGGESEGAAFVHKLYLKLRPTNPDMTSTLEQIALLLRTKRDKLPPSAPPGDPSLLRGWAIEGGWEHAYSVRDGVSALDGEESRAKIAWREAQTYLAVSKDRLDSFNRLADLNPDIPLDEKRANTFVKLSTQVLRWQSAVNDAESEYRKVLLERQTDEAIARIEIVYQEYLSQYSGLGPQYEHLCKQAAIITVRMEQMQSSGRLVPLDEFAKMEDTYIKVVGQLQKYTESTKSESISKETVAMVKAMLRVVGEVIHPVSPKLWRDAVRAVDAKIGTVRTDDEKAG